MKVLSCKRNLSEHPLDQHYRGLQCALEPLDHTNDDFKVCLSVSACVHVCERVF